MSFIVINFIFITIYNTHCNIKIEKCINYICLTLGSCPFERHFKVFYFYSDICLSLTGLLYRYFSRILLIFLLHICIFDKLVANFCMVMRYESSNFSSVYNQLSYKASFPSKLKFHLCYISSSHLYMVLLFGYSL